MIHRLPLRFLLLALFALSFHSCFWLEKLSLNLVLYILLAGGTSLLLQREALKNRYVQLTGLGTLLIGCFVLVHASTMARVGMVLSFSVFLGFVYAPEMRSLPMVMVGSVTAPFIGFFKTLEVGLMRMSGHHRANLRPWQRKWRRYALVSVVPLVLVVVFAGLFGVANEHFGALMDQAFGQLGQVIEELLMALSPERLIMLILGTIIGTWTLFRVKPAWLARTDATAPVDLTRKRRRRPRFFRTLALRREYTTALLAVGAINVLTLLQNGLDFYHVWIAFDPTSLNLTQFVHEGTYVLILSILLAMGIMFYFFRGNLNFLQQNHWLRTLTYVWIGQNLFMVLSVALRNYHYITESGLAYKRIGVFFFLALTAFGLITLALKIRRRKTVWQVVRVNGWATYAVLILLSAFNWDGLITRYNLTYTPDKLDVQFLMDMSDKTLPLLWEHQDLFAERACYDDGSYIFGREWMPAQDVLERRIIQLHRRQEHRTWMSWNLGDARAMSYFEGQTTDFDADW